MTATATALASFGLAAAHAQPAPDPGMPAASTLKVMSATFRSSDLDRSIAFYTKALGLKPMGRVDNPKVTEVPLVFPGGDMSLLLIQPKAAAETAAKPRIGRVILAVPDLKALEARIVAAGYRLSSPVRGNTQHHVMVAEVADPDGNELELVQRGR